MRRRSNLLVLLGIAVFLIGAALVFVVLDDDGDDGGSAAPGNTTVVVAKEALSRGADGDDVLAEGQVDTKEVPTGSAPAGALLTEGELANTSLATDVAAGSVITQSLITRDVPSIVVPEGFEAVAVQFDFLGGAAQYVAVGDRINVFAIVSGCEAFRVGGGGAPDLVDSGAEQHLPCPYTTPRAELLLTNVLVLDVSRQTAPTSGSGATTAASGSGTATTQPETVDRDATGGDVVLLLAAATNDAEKLIYQTEFQRMYVTITADEAPPAGATTGRDFTNILAEEPGAAFQSSNPEG